MADPGDAQWEEDAFNSVSLGLSAPYIVPRGTTLPGRQRYLIFFLHRHLSFRLAEAQCLAELVYGKLGY